MLKKEAKKKNNRKLITSNTIGNSKNFIQSPTETNIFLQVAVCAVICNRGVASASRYLPSTLTDCPPLKYGQHLM